MATIFFDTSALVRRYDWTEPGARSVRAACSPESGNAVIVAELATVELASAFSRKVREGSFSAQTVERLWHLFKAHWQEEYQVILLTVAICNRAEQLLFDYPLRAYDAVQIGTALSAAERATSGPEFWTADRRQAQVAAAEGLTVQLVG
ncbi:MAG: type II toxin-antitoxin system VapC family toxin [Thermomicrobiales bacterium]